MSDMVSNGYLKDKNGKVMEIVDKAARDGVERLIEEIAELKGEAEKEPVTFIPDLTGGYKKDGSFSTANTTRHTDYIPLDGYARIVAKAYIVDTYYALAFFTKEKEILPGVSIVGAGVVTPNEISMAIPEGAAYCMLSNYFGSSNEYSDTYITLYPADIIASPLHGKKIAFLGDSITTTKYATHNYWQLIGEKTGCICLNYGVAKSRLATVEGDDVDSFVTRAAAMDTSADCVVVMGGTNDVGLHTLLGEWASEDVTTFYGAMNALIILLRTNYPGKPIIFCTPIKRKHDTDNGFPDTMADLKAASATEQITMQHCVLAIKAKCARHGIPVIDLAEHSGFSPETPEYYYSESDNLHPSALGYVRIANMVHAELEKQFLYAAVEDDGDGDGSTTNQVKYTSGIQGYVKTDGTIITTGNTWRTDYLALDGVTRIAAQYRIINTAYVLAFYDSNKTLMHDVSIVGAGTDKDYTVDVIPPEGAAYCIFSHYYGSDGYTGWVTLYS